MPSLPPSRLISTLRWNLIIGWTAGVLCFILLLSIPTDFDNVWLLGYSASRWSLILLQGLALLLATYFTFRSLRGGGLARLQHRLVNFGAEQIWADVLLWGAGLFLTSSLIYFLAIVNTATPYLTRIIPLVLWLAILSLQVLIFAFRFTPGNFPEIKPPPAVNLRTRVKWISIILLLGTGLRLYVLYAYDLPLEETRRQKVAVNLAEQRSMAYCHPYFPFCEPDNDQTASVEPLPVLIFGIIMILVDNQPAYLGVLLQMILGILSIGIVYFIVRFMFDDHRSAFLGALIWSLYLPLVLEVEASLKGEAIFSFFLGLGMAVILLALDRQRVGLWLLAGFFLGLAALSRSVLIYFIPVLLLILLLLPGTSSKRRMANSLVLVLSFTLTLTPWVRRNYQTFNAFIPGVTLSGYNLYRHNYYIGTEDPFHYVYNDEIEAVQEILLEENVGFLSGSEDEYQMDRFYASLALDVITANPSRYLLLSAYRFIPLWTNFGVRYGFISDLTWNLSGIGNLAFLALALVSMARRRFHRPPKIIPIIALILFFTLSHMLVNARMRFVIPAIPYVIAFACDQLVFWADSRKLAGTRQQDAAGCSPR